MFYHLSRTFHDVFAFKPVFSIKKLNLLGNATGASKITQNHSVWWIRSWGHQGWVFTSQPGPEVQGSKYSGLILVWVCQTWILANWKCFNTLIRLIHSIGSLGFLLVITLPAIIVTHGVLVSEWTVLCKALLGFYNQNSIVNSCPCRWLDS